MSANAPSLFSRVYDCRNIALNPVIFVLSVRILSKLKIYKKKSKK